MKITKLDLSSRNKNYETLIINYKEQLPNFKYQVQRKIAKL